MKVISTFDEFRRVYTKASKKRRAVLIDKLAEALAPRLAKEIKKLQKKGRAR